MLGERDISLADEVLPGDEQVDAEVNRVGMAIINQFGWDGERIVVTRQGGLA